MKKNIIWSIIRIFNVLIASLILIGGIIAGIIDWINWFLLGDIVGSGFAAFIIWVLGSAVIAFPLFSIITLLDAIRINTSSKE